jgi:predicted nucleotidyltransferase
MKKLDQIQQILTEEKPYLLDRFGVVEIGVFGSYIR